MTKQSDCDVDLAVGVREVDAARLVIGNQRQQNATPSPYHAAAISLLTQNREALRPGSKRSVCWSIRTFSADLLVEAAVETGTRETKVEADAGNVRRLSKRFDFV